MSVNSNDAWLIILSQNAFAGGDARVAYYVLTITYTDT